MRGMASGIAVIVLPMIGWVILPHIYEVHITEHISEYFPDEKILVTSLCY